MAVKFLMQQTRQGGQFLAGREADVTDSGVNGVGASASEKGSEGKDVFNEAIDQLFPDTK